METPEILRTLAILLAGAVSFASYRMRQRLSGALLRLLARGAQRFSQPLALRLRGEAIRVAPDSWRNYLARARQLYALHNMPLEAIQDVESGLSLTADSPELYTLRAEIIFALGDYPRALADLDVLKKRWPGYGNTAFLRGQCLKYLGRLVEALPEYEAYLAREPRHLKSLQGKAQCLHNLDRYAESLEAVSFALELYPDDANLLEGAVRTRLALERPGEAVLFASRLVAASRGAARAHALRAEALEGDRQYERALQDRQQAAKLKPGHAPYWYHLAQLCGQLEKPRAAEKCLRKALRLKPEVATLHLNLGMLLEDRGDLLGALGEYDAAVRLDDKDPDHYYFRARALLELDRPAESERDLDLAIKMTDKDPHYFYLRGKIYEQQKEFNKALVDYSRVIDLDPKCGPAYERRGAVYFDLGDKERARQDSAAARKIMHGE